MRYINTLCEGETIRNIYLCKGKRSAETRNGKPYVPICGGASLPMRETKAAGSEIYSVG